MVKPSVSGSVPVMTCHRVCSYYCRILIHVFEYRVAHARLVSRGELGVSGTPEGINDGVVHGVSVTCNNFLVFSSALVILTDTTLEESPSAVAISLGSRSST